MFWGKEATHYYVKYKFTKIILNVERALIGSATAYPASHTNSFGLESYAF